MVARYPLNLPQSLKSKAAAQARKQGVSLNQFFLWSISEKVTELDYSPRGDASLDDPRFPNIVYRRGEAGTPTPVIRGTGLRVQTIAISHHKWNEPVKELVEDYDMTAELIQEALDFYQAHLQEIDTLIRIEGELEQQHDQAKTAP